MGSGIARGGQGGCCPPCPPLAMPLPNRHTVRQIQFSIRRCVGQIVSCVARDRAAAPLPYPWLRNCPQDPLMTHPPPPLIITTEMDILLRLTELEHFSQSEAAVCYLQRAQNVYSQTEELTLSVVELAKPRQ